MFPASIKSEAKQIFVTRKELNGVKKSILNGKVHGLVSIIDLDKISNWNEIRGQSIWIRVAFKDQEEINNNSHLCFPFMNRSLNDLTSFSIYLPDDKNKEIEFESGEQKTKHFELSNWYLPKMSKTVRPNKTAQQIKEEQINFLLEDIEKKLEEYKKALDLRKKQLLDAKKILSSAKKSYDKTVAENKELRIYI